jgi:CHAT domain-containing protein
MPVEAIAAGESGKALGYASLLRGEAEIEESGLGAWLGARRTEASDDAHLIASRARMLGEGDAALSYLFLGADEKGTPSIAIGVLTRERVDATRVPYGKAFTTAFRELPAAVRRNDTAAAQAAGAVIYDALIAPVTAALAGKRRLFLSLHSSLQKLPWGALFDGSRFLAERFTLARVPPLLVPGRVPSDDRAAFGGADTSQWLLVLDPAHPPLPPLPGIEAMKEELTTALHPAITLQGAEASAGRLIDSLGSVQAMLYAGHAEYDAVRPLRSALLVAPAPAQGDRVDAASLIRARHPLDVVLLVGCETATQYSKRTKYSDDLIGLPRALLATGTRHVIGTLWPVLDRDSEDFVRALMAPSEPLDAASAFGAAQACMARGKCASRGIAAWGTFVLDTR